MVPVIQMKGHILFMKASQAWLLSVRHGYLLIVKASQAWVPFSQVWLPFES